MVRLNLKPDECNLYLPPQGIDVCWVNWEKPDVVVAEFGCSDLQPDPKYQKTKSDILHELGSTFRNRVITDDIGGSYHLSTPRFMKLDVVLDHPLITNAEGPNAQAIKRAADAASEVHDVELTNDQMELMKNSFTTEKTRHLRKLRNPIEPKEKRARTRKVYDRDSQGRQIVRDEFVEEVNIMSVGTIDSG